MDKWSKNLAASTLSVLISYFPNGFVWNGGPELQAMHSSAFQGNLWNTLPAKQLCTPSSLCIICKKNWKKVSVSVWFELNVFKLSFHTVTLLKASRKLSDKLELSWHSGSKSEIQSTFRNNCKKGIVILSGLKKNISVSHYFQCLWDITVRADSIYSVELSLCGFRLKTNRNTVLGLLYDIWYWHFWFENCFASWWKPMK